MLLRGNKFDVSLCTLAVMLVVIGTLGCAGPYYSHSFKTDWPDAYRASNVLALAPVEVPSDLPKADQAEQFFAFAISEKLRMGGFQVVGPDVYEQTMFEITRERGGSYDVITGKKDEKKFQELQRACLKQLETTTGAKALLQAKVVVVSAPFSGCQASWDGATQSIAHAYLGIFCPIGNMFGKIAAFSLVRSIFG
ncbi:MAG: hypothetical protein C4581_12470 [Nitrospiraceae bacterium]|nr:MAG: hypothetical protein C4581_12470 [Nitrospiraceae bacterium]